MQLFIENNGNMNVPSSSVKVAGVNVGGEIMPDYSRKINVASNIVVNPLVWPHPSHNNIKSSYSSY